MTLPGHKKWSAMKMAMCEKHCKRRCSIHRNVHPVCIVRSEATPTQSFIANNAIRRRFRRCFVSRARGYTRDDDVNALFRLIGLLTGHVE